MIQVKYLIVGSSAAGISAANILAKIEPNTQILCVTAESSAPYNKCFLVDWLAGEKESDQVLLVVNPQIKFLFNTKVIAINPDIQVAYLSNGDSVSYQKALLAIGVQAFVPPIMGIPQAQHVFTFHDFLDTQKVVNFIDYNQPKHAIVIGAGLTGLECADALARKGLQVTVVERSSQVLSKLIDECGAHKLMGWMSDFGVKLELNRSVAQILARQVLLDNGAILLADLVIVAAGVRPNRLEIIGSTLDYWHNYVLVNKQMQTNLPNIWAAGDMVALPDLLKGELVPSCSWPDAMLQGSIAAQTMAGGDKSHPGLFTVANSHFFGKDFISFGSVDACYGLYDKTPSKIEFIESCEKPGSYQKIALDQSGLLMGAILIGDISLYPALKRAILTKTPWQQQNRGC